MLIILGGSLVMIGVFRNCRNKSILQQINDRELLELKMELDKYDFDEIKKIISSIRNDMNEDLSNISKSYTFNVVNCLLELVIVDSKKNWILTLSQNRELNTVKLLDSVIIIPEQRKIDNSYIYIKID